MAKSTSALPAHVDFDDFRAYMPTHQYIFMPTGELWTTASVDSRLPKRIVKDGSGNDVTIKASTWLDQHQPVEQMTWCPGQPRVIQDYLVSDGGWLPRPGCACFNLYRPPLPLKGSVALAGPWIDHVRHIYPSDADEIIAWLAHRVQKPHEKINHALVMGGKQGIGKDALLEPVKHAIGPWNFIEVSPAHMMGRFNGFVKSVILRINEARDLGDIDRFSFYDHTKIYTATPPDVLRVDEKHLREYAVFNVCGVILTTNHKTDGIHLEADDRRHFVAWSDLSREDFDADYFVALFAWYTAGGLGHVAAYLRAYDLSDFDPKAPPRQTDAWQAIVDANRASEDAELADVLERLGTPAALTLSELAEPPTPKPFGDWLSDPKNRRAIPHRLASRGYEPVRNPYAKDGLWVLNRRRQVIYSLATLTKSERQHAAEVIVNNGSATF